MTFFRPVNNLLAVIFFLQTAALFDVIFYLVVPIFLVLKKQDYHLLYHNY